MVSEQKLKLKPAGVPREYACPTVVMYLGFSSLLVVRKGKMTATVRIGLFLDSR